MSIYIASDHAGFEQKTALYSFLKQEGYDVVDLGPETDDRVDYPDFAATLGRAVAQDPSNNRGILVCGTGIGMAIAANKIDGIRAANVVSEEFATLAREHNNANVLTLSGRFVTLEENKKCVRAFLTTAFGEGRHAGRVEKIMKLED